MDTTLHSQIEDEALLQSMAALDSVADADKRVALLLRADDIRSGKNESCCPEHLRAAVADKLEAEARTWECV